MIVTYEQFIESEEAAMRWCEKLIKGQRARLEEGKKRSDKLEKMEFIGISSFINSLTYEIQEIKQRKLHPERYI